MLMQLGMCGCVNGQSTVLELLSHRTWKVARHNKNGHAWGLCTMHVCQTSQHQMHMPVWIAFYRVQYLPAL